MGKSAAKSKILYNLRFLREPCFSLSLLCVNFSPFTFHYSSVMSYGYSWSKVHCFGTENPQVRVQMTTGSASKTHWFRCILPMYQMSCYIYNPKSSIRLLRANKPSFCHLSCRFSVTMEPHCALKSTIHLLKNIVYYHHNANERFGIIITKKQYCGASSGAFMTIYA